MTIDALFIRRAVVCASAVVYWGGVAIQARRIRKRIGKSANLKPRTPKEKLLWAGWTLMILGWLFQPLLIPNAQLPVSFLTPLTLTLGIALVILGYAATLWCYTSMGDTWRIGVNRNEKTSLVTRGPYRVIRHPIYGFQIVMLVGAALLLPTIYSLLIIAIHFICVQAKAADEEAYLLTVHGETYREYLNRTRRLFPKLIRG
jgi:protein-S-isoprenylcysteine O-methyltransferase Ste14